MRLMTSALALTLAACQHIDTGQIDYRIAEGAKASASAIALCVNKSQGCDFSDQAPLIRKYSLPNSAFTKGQKYSIELEQAVVGTQILETVIFGKEYGKVAQFAILANAFEFAKADGDKATRRFLESTEYDGAKDPGDVELKLVYYGDDMRRRQPFNFSNVPVLARSEYHGGSIGIQIVVMELDTESGPVNSLLKTLAKFGEKALPAASPLNGVIQDLGESMLSGGSTDDRLFDFRFVLSGDEFGTTNQGPTFAPGRYVLRRQKDRENPMDWSRYKLDHNTGRLYKDGTEVRDEFYLVLNVKQYESTVDDEFYAGLDYSAFQEQAKAIAADRDKPLSALNKLVRNQLSNNLRADLLGRWRAAHQAMNQLVSRSHSNLETPSQCEAQREKLRIARDQSDLAMRNAIRDFVSNYQAALTEREVVEGSELKESDFESADREALVSTVSRSFMPWDGGTAPEGLTSAENFEAAYIANGPTALNEYARSRANAFAAVRGPGDFICAT